MSHPQCVRIKIHPVEHDYDIRDHGDKVFAFTARLGVVVLTHSGDLGSVPELFVPFLNQYPEVRLIFAHLGHSKTKELSLQVNAIQQCTGSDVYVDTSSSGSMKSGLIEFAVREIGSGRMLFGTDTPLYSAAAQKARIEHADITDEDKQNIFSLNAGRLFEGKL